MWMTCAQSPSALLGAFSEAGIQCLCLPEGKELAKQRLLVASNLGQAQDHRAGQGSCWENPELQTRTFPTAAGSVTTDSKSGQGQGLAKGDPATSMLRLAKPGPGRKSALVKITQQARVEWTRIQPSHNTKHSSLHQAQAPWLTPELKATQLEGDEAIANFDEVDQGVEVVGGQDKAVTRAIVAPAAQHQVPTQCVL